MKKVIYVKENEVKDYKEEEKEFANMPEEIRWGEYAGAFEEYLYQGEQMGRVIILEKNKNIMSDKIYSPADYAREFGIEENIRNDISLAEFEEIVGDCTTHNLWNYPLTEYSEIVENDGKVVLVKFETDGYRFVEVE